MRVWLSLWLGAQCGCHREPGSVSRRCVRCGARDVPRAPLPEASVTAFRVVSPTTSKGATPSSSLLRAHAPDHRPPPGFRIPTYTWWSLQVAASPCWAMVLPDVISARLSQDAWAMIPAVRQVHMPVASLTSSAFPTLFQMGRLYRLPPLRDGTADPIARSLLFLLRSGLVVCSPPRSPLPLRPMP